MTDRVCVILSPQALRDRDACLHYLVEHHAYDAALLFLDRLDESLDTLARMPLSGREFTVTRDLVLRKANIRSFSERVFYVWNGTSVYVTRIVSMRRNILPDDLT
ncbi:MAG: type II toxin-antitoxin system RelE/ParE family toxin [Blastochloris sp.]|nr:type II toxin-antitoxin system RelE/ParE family toxin [Blastochloris sp.]